MGKRATVFVSLSVLLSCRGIAPPLAPLALEAPAPRPATVAPWPAFGPVDGKARARDDDGIAYLDVELPALGSTGAVRWIPPVFATLEGLPEESSDGERVYFAASRANGFHDVLVRDGRVVDDVVSRLARARAAGGCGAVGRRGVLFVAGKRFGEPDSHDPTGAWRLDASGALVAVDLPGETDAECAAWLDDDSAFAIAGRDLRVFDGARFVDRTEAVAVPSLLRLAGARGPRHCDEGECTRGGTKDESVVPHDEASLRTLRAALGPCAPPTPAGAFAALGDFLAMACPSGRVARMKRGEAPEVAEHLPPSRLLNGRYDVALTSDGDVVVGTAAAMHSYVVWRHGESALSPVRTTPPGERISHSSPPVHLRGLLSPIPAESVSSVLLTKPVRLGSTARVAYRRPMGGAAARLAQAERARQVLGDREIHFVGEAAIEASCGSYTRAPVGHEGMQISDFTPPPQPKLDPALVSKPDHCIGIDRAIALPGNPDFLLAKTADGHLASAWLGAEPRLPPGFDWRRGVPAGGIRTTSASRGSGWTVHPFTVEELVGEQSFSAPRNAPSDAATPTMSPTDTTRRAPDSEAEVWDRPYYRAGLGVVRLRDADILVGPRVAVKLPGAMVPQAVIEGSAPRILGSVGAALVVCDTTCRTLDPGPRGAILSVVPRTRDLVVLTYDDGRMGLYEIPSKGGVDAGDHPLSRRLRAVLEHPPE